VSYPHFPHPLLLLLNKIFKKDRRILLEGTMKNFRSASPENLGFLLQYLDLENSGVQDQALAKIIAMQSPTKQSIENPKTQSASS
jgi:hypothetical protein